MNYNIKMNNKIVSTGQLFLGGGGKAEDSLKLDKRFLKALKNKKIVYLPIALTPKGDGYESCYDWITSTLTKKSNDFVEIDMWTDLNGKNMDNLKNYDGIYIGGGNTYKLLDHFYKTGFAKILIDYYYQGGLIYGGSAGAVILGKIISLVTEENNTNYIYENGLNLLNGKSVICHYTDKRVKKIRNFLQKNKTDVIALTERSGIVVSNTYQVESVGFDPVLLYPTSLTSISFNPGNKFFI